MTKQRYEPNYTYSFCGGPWQDIYVDAVTGECYNLDGTNIPWHIGGGEFRDCRLADLEGNKNHRVASLQTTVIIKPEVTGGPSEYYDLPFKEWVTTNDMVEYFSLKSWNEYSVHMKEILKAIVRWGNKNGTTKEYDSKKIIYYGARILRMVSGTKVLRQYLQELLDNEQFRDDN